MTNTVPYFNQLFNQLKLHTELDLLWGPLIGLISRGLEIPATAVPSCQILTNNNDPRSKLLGVIDHNIFNSL